MRGKTFCWSHRQQDTDMTDRQIATDNPENERVRRDRKFSEAVNSGGSDELVNIAVERILRTIGQKMSLEDEIGALRLVLKRVITLDALDGDPKETAATVARLSDSIVRAVRAQRAISGDLAEDLSEALTTVLIEMGLGAEDE